MITKLTRKRLLPTSVMLCVILSSCSYGVQDPSPQNNSAGTHQEASDTPREQGEVTFKVNGEENKLSKDKTNYLNSLSVSDSIPIEIEFKDEDAQENKKEKVLVDGKELSFSQGVYSGFMTVEKIHNDSQIEVLVERDKDTDRYLIETLPEDYPKFHFEENGELDEQVFYYSNFSTSKGEEIKGPYYITKFNSDGDIIYYKKDSEYQLLNFEKFDTGDFSGYYYFQEKEGIEPRESSYQFGEYVIMDDNFSVVDRVVPVNTEKYTKDPQTAESHDFLVVEKGHYYILDYIRDENGDDIPTISMYIQEVKDGEVLWEWHSDDNDRYRSIARDESKAHCYPCSFLDNIHTNSMNIDPSDGNLILSNRNTSEIVKINTHSGEVMWVLGGENNQFDLGGLDAPKYQHDAVIHDDGTLTYFNNNHRDKSYGVKIQLNQEEKKVESYQKYELGNQRGFATGSMTALEDGSVAVGWGLLKTKPMISTLFKEDGTPVQNIVSTDGNLETYRVRVERE